MTDDLIGLHGCEEILLSEVLCTLLTECCVEIWKVERHILSRRSYRNLLHFLHVQSQTVVKGRRTNIEYTEDTKVSLSVW